MKLEVCILVFTILVSNFVIILLLKNINSSLKEIKSSIFTGATIILNDQISDLEKERTVRKSSIKIIKLSILLMGITSIIILSFCSGPILIHLIKNTSFYESFLYLTYPKYILITLILFVIQYKFFYKKSNDNDNDNNETYTFLDKFVHSLAMNTLVLKICSKIEYHFGLNFQANNHKPIFIIGLARSGSTALLNALYSIPEFGSYTYRDMPFITLSTISRKIFKQSKNKSFQMDRAHNDGHKIDIDSPEAFEEILWKLYYPSIYKNKYIKKIKPDDISREFELFFKNQTCKIANISARAKFINKKNFSARYLSKNNANIARINAIKKIYPNAIFIAPLRDPIEHAYSLLSQHLRFAQKHVEDPFILKYMNDLGHYEFGANHKTLKLDSPFEVNEEPHNLEYWLKYWIYAYKYLQNHQTNIKFVSLKNLIDNENETMKKLLKNIGNNSFWKKKQSFFLKSQAKLSVSRDLNPKLKNQAYIIYNDLLLRSL